MISKEKARKILMNSNEDFSEKDLEILLEHLKKIAKVAIKDFKNKINTKDSLFNIWFVQLKGIATYCKTIHKKYFASSLNTTKKENDPIDKKHLL